MLKSHKVFGYRLSKVDKDQEERLECLNVEIIPTGTEEQVQKWQEVQKSRKENLKEVNSFFYFLEKRDFE